MRRIGNLVGFLLTYTVMALAVGLPAFRDRIETVMFAWCAIAPGVATALAFVVATAILGSPDGRNDF